MKIIIKLNKQMEKLSKFSHNLLKSCHLSNMENSELLSPNRDSLLTSSSGYTNYRGVLNLIVILLFLSNARAALENIIKYGILVDPLQWLRFLVEGSKHWLAVLICATMVLHCLISFSIERLIAHQWLSQNNHDNHSENTKKKSPTRDGLAQTIWGCAHGALVANLLACLTIPPILVFSGQTHIYSASCALILVSIVFLKLYSYHMMNYWCRDLKKPLEERSRITKSFLRSYVPPRVEFGKLEAKSKEEITLAGLNVMDKYPNNLNLNDFFMYLCFPTLCYELEYARSTRIRKRFLIKRVLEVIILSQIVLALIQQWIVPTVSNSLIPFRHMQLSHMLERLLKLAIPNHVIWVIWFYLFFHSLLNIQAELTRFADREFYRDWWNSESVHYFWSHWNIPVHKWCARHLYLPLLSFGLTRCQAGAAVFFVSAFFHEYLVSVPLKMFRVWAFTSMLIQLPWARFVSSHFSNNSANVAVWVSIILGQPLVLLMYYHDYYVHSISH